MRRTFIGCPMEVGGCMGLVRLILVAQDWIEMTKLISRIKKDQNNLANRLQSLLEIRNEELSQRITESLGETFWKHDQQFLKIKNYIETIQEDILSVKDSFLTFAQNSCALSSENVEEEHSKQRMLMDSFAQTEYEIRKRKSHVKNTEAAKLIAAVKKCLVDLMEDTKFHLSIDREEENRELQIILRKLAEDREDIKRIIGQAFTVVAEQAKKNLEQFGQTGQEAMHFVAVLNDKNRRMITSKLKHTDDKLREILNVMNREVFDISGIPDVLKNIHGQLDKAFQRVQVECQKNSKNCEEMALSLEKMADKCGGTVSNLETMAKGLTEDNKNIKKMLSDMQNLLGFQSSQKNIDSYSHSENNEAMNIAQCDPDNTVEQNSCIFSQKQTDIAFTYSTMQSCGEKMMHLNNRIGNRCDYICKLTDELEQKLTSLNESAEQLDTAIQNISILNSIDNQLCPHNRCTRTNNADNGISMTQCGNIGDADDGQNPTLNIENGDTNENLTEKEQTFANEEAREIIDRLLKEVCEKTRPRYQSKGIVMKQTLQDPSVTEKIPLGETDSK